MRFSWRTMAATLCYALGNLGWCYVGIWMILTRPLKGLWVAHMAGSLSFLHFFGALVQGFLYLSLAGAVWCIGYMLSNYLKEEH